MSLVNQINALLPQTQCRRCGYEGCLPYAKAISTGQAHNQCPPGGNTTIQALSHLLNRPEIPLNPAHGALGPRYVAIIDESQCIGCTKCLQACPVDAIAGAAKWMHSVITDECSGCELCIAPCPVDCIHLVLAPPHLQSELLKDEDREKLRQQFETRYHQRCERIENEKRQEELSHQQAVRVGHNQADNIEAKRAYIEAAKYRVQNKKNKP